MVNYSTGKCYHCGADEGLHHYDTIQCPKNGIEETRFDKLNQKYYPQQWETTTFEDSGIKKVELASPDLLKAANEALIQLLVAFNFDINMSPDWVKNLDKAIKKATE